MLEKRLTERSGCRIETRDGGKSVLTGYAAVFYDAGDPGTEYQLWYGVRERVAVGAFNRPLAEKDDVRGLYNHDPNHIFGRTSAGTMRLSVDERGLLYEIDLPETTLAKDLAVSITRGDVDGSSFGFQVSKESWEFGKDFDVRVIEEVSPIYDVGPVVFPAYEGTTAGIRSSLLRTENDHGEAEKYLRERHAKAMRDQKFWIDAQLRCLKNRIPT
jgi:uncharacterized protein